MMTSDGMKNPTPTTQELMQENIQRFFVHGFEDEDVGKLFPNFSAALNAIDQYAGGLQNQIRQLSVAAQHNEEFAGEWAEQIDELDQYLDLPSEIERLRLLYNKIANNSATTSIEKIRAGEMVNEAPKILERAHQYAKLSAELYTAILHGARGEDLSETPEHRQAMIVTYELAQNVKMFNALKTATDEMKIFATDIQNASLKR